MVKSSPLIKWSVILMVIWIQGDLKSDHLKSGIFGGQISNGPLFRCLLFRSQLYCRDLNTENVQIVDGKKTVQLVNGSVFKCHSKSKHPTIWNQTKLSNGPATFLNARNHSYTDHSKSVYNKDGRTLVSVCRKCVNGDNYRCSQVRTNQNSSFYRCL